jgi:DNA repair exonuclease SbcCD ATPase subunit
LKDHKEIKTKLKDCNKDELLKLSNSLAEAIAKAEEEKAEHEAQISAHEEIIADFDKDLLEYTSKIVPVKQYSGTINSLRATTERLKIGIENAQRGLDLSENAVKLAKELLKNLKPVVSEYNQNKARLPVLKKQAALIETIPGQDVCKTCSLASHAYKAKDEHDELVDVMATDALLVETFKQKDEYLKLVEDIELMKRDLDIQESALNEMLAAESDINANAEWRHKIDEIKRLKMNCQQVLAKHNKDLMDAVARIASSKTKLSDIERKIKVEAELTGKDEIYSLYLDAMGKNGISYWIISKKLVLINKLVNQILSYAVPFRFSIEDNEEEKSIKIFVIDEKGKRPAELCSGGEKTIVGLALRAALWKICLLPKTPILILDESLSFLDGERHDSVIKLLKHLSQDYFDKIFLVTHNEELKRVVDTSIMIDKKKGFSFVEVK